MPRVAFISGPLDAPQSYFDEHYAPRLHAAIHAGDSFIMGPVSGIDTLALHFLLANGVAPNRITVYMAAFEYQDARRRRRYEEELGVGVRKVDSEGLQTTTGMRDACMTEESDYDVLRYRTESEAREWFGEAWWPRVTNTEMNERRRRGIWSREYNLERSVSPVEEVGGREWIAGAGKADGSSGKNGGIGKRIRKELGK